MASKMTNPLKHYYKHAIMEAIEDGKRLDSVEVGSLAIKGHDVSKPLAAMEELIEDGHIRWEWVGFNKILVKKG